MVGESATSASAPASGSPSLGTKQVLRPLLLSPHKGVKRRLLFVLAPGDCIGIERLAHDAGKLRSFRLLSLQLLQEVVIVRIEDQHVLVCHLGEGVVRVDDRSDELRVFRRLSDGKGWTGIFHLMLVLWVTGSSCSVYGKHLLTTDRARVCSTAILAGLRGSVRTTT